MSVERNIRASSISVALPFRSQWPRWDYVPEGKDRAHAAFLYRGPREIDITSTRTLELPVDYFMEGLPQYRASGRTFEPGRGVAKEEVKLSAGPRGRISGPAPSVTTRTTKRGYD
jgi:hypothetical protein